MLVIHTPNEIATTTLFLFQMAMLESPIRAKLRKIEKR